nr:9835_t:CDS:2 [Entrophospora candida]
MGGANNNSVKYIFHRLVENPKRISHNNCEDNVDDHSGEKNDLVALVDDIEDTTSEESEDITLVEFNSYEIKNKISNVSKPTMIFC